MAKRTVSLDEVPDACRIKWRNDFIVSVAQSWAKGEGLTDKGIAGDVAKGQINEFVEQMQAFQRERLDFGDVGRCGAGVTATSVNVTPWPDRVGA
jgi:hypothetical protein